MSRKMILLPVERYNALIAQTKEPAKRPDALDVPPAAPPDVKVKILRENKMRKKQVKPQTQQQQQQLHQQSSNLQGSVFTPDLSKMTGKKKTRAKAFIKHINRNKDRIKFDKGELQFDGIKTGGTDMADLTTALIDDKNPGKVAGWNDLMRALEGTGAPASLYTRWRKSHKKGDWGALAH